MKTLLLINPPQPYLVRPGMIQPMGLLCLAAQVREHALDYDVGIVDLCRLSIEDGIDAVQREAATRGGRLTLGFTATSLEIPIINRVIDALRGEGDQNWFTRNARIIVGGVGPSLNPEYITHNADAVFVGDSDDALVGYLRGDSTGIGRVDRVMGKEVYLAIPPADLDALPYPALDLIGEFGPPTFFAGNRVFMPGNALMVSGSRGCPYNCAFCANRGLRETGMRPLRYNSVQRVVEELEYVYRHYGVTHVRFGDEAVANPRRRAVELCEAILDAGLNIAWQACIRTKPADMELFELMYRAGCREVNLGVESADQAVLEQLNKRATVEDAAAAIANAKQAGLQTRVLLMIGCPGETEETVDKNIAFIEKVQPTLCSCTRFVPLPGSDIWKRPERYGVRILTRDLTKYNMYNWGPDGANPVHLLMEYTNLTHTQVCDNVTRMRDYLHGKNNANRG